MVIEILILCIIARLKGYRLRYLFRTWTFYPILTVQLALVVVQSSLFFRDYTFVSLVPYLQAAVILSFMFAIVAFRLYTPAIWGSASIAAGSLLNKLVIAQNGGKMPVFPSLSILTGYVTPDMIQTLDTLHVLGGADTRLNFLADYIDYGYSILSPGDLLIHLFTCIVLYALIKAVNARFDRA